MTGKTSIEWATLSWNPTTGCTRVSAGCDNCYAFQLHDQRHVAWKRGRMPKAAPQYRLPFSKVQLFP
jgi:protein gp37